MSELTACTECGFTTKSAQEFTAHIGMTRRFVRLISRTNSISLKFSFPRNVLFCICISPIYVLNHTPRFGNQQCKALRNGKIYFVWILFILKMNSSIYEREENTVIHRIAEQHEEDHHRSSSGELSHTQVCSCAML